MDYDNHDYYKKYDYYVIAFSCVLILTFLACVYLNSKDKDINPKSNNTNTATVQVIDKKELKEALDDLSQKLDTIRERLKKEDEKEKGVLDDSKQKTNR